MFWLVGVVVGIGAAVLVLRWALRSHRDDRRPWLELLDEASVEGLADDGGGSLQPIVAPFSGRQCLGYVIEIVVEEQFGNETTFHRALMDGAGQLFLVGRDGRRSAWADLRGGRAVFPTPLSEYGKYSSSLTSETIFHGPMERAPAHLVAFVQRLDAETQALVWRPSGQLIGGKRIYFNERIVLPGQAVVVAGARESGPVGIHVVPSEEMPVSLALGTIASERARVATLPVAGEMFGAVMAGAIVCAAVDMVLAMTIAK